MNKKSFLESEILTDEQKGILAICEINKLEKRKEIIWRWHIGRLEIKFEWRSKKNLWGRFGGGWNWQFGFEAGGGTIIFSLLIATLRFNLQEKKT